MSDHCSGPRAIAGPAGDICDLYAFTSPEWPGHLALVMTVLPRATADSFFSDAIVCRFRLRPVTIAATGPGAAFAVGPEETELVFDCTFDVPYSHHGAGPRQRGCCTPPSGEPIAFECNHEQGAASDGTASRDCTRGMSPAQLGPGSPNVPSAGGASQASSSDPK